MGKLQQVEKITQIQAKSISEQIQELRTAQTDTAEKMAEKLEPLALSMSILSEEMTEKIRMLNEQVETTQTRMHRAMSAVVRSMKKEKENLSSEQRSLISSIQDLQEETEKTETMLKKIKNKALMKLIAITLTIALATSAGVSIGCFHYQKAYLQKQTNAKIVKIVDRLRFSNETKQALKKIFLQEMERGD